MVDVRTTSTNVRTSKTTVPQTKELAKTLQDLTHALALMDSAVVDVARILTNALRVPVRTTAHASTRGAASGAFACQVRRARFMFTILNPNDAPSIVNVTTAAAATLISQQCPSCSTLLEFAPAQRLEVEIGSLFFVVRQTFVASLHLLSSEPIKRTETRHAKKLSLGRYDKCTVGL